MEQKQNSTELKRRILDAKENLPKSGITSLYFHYYKDEVKATSKNVQRLSNVLQLRVVDEDITKKVEALVLLLNKKQQQ